jgi:hypothetical protein
MHPSHSTRCANKHSIHTSQIFIPLSSINNKPTTIILVPACAINHHDKLTPTCNQHSYWLTIERVPQNKRLPREPANVCSRLTTHIKAKLITDANAAAKLLQTSQRPGLSGTSQMSSSISQTCSSCLPLRFIRRGSGSVAPAALQNHTSRFPGDDDIYIANRMYHNKLITKYNTWIRVWNLLRTS